MEEMHAPLQGLDIVGTHAGSRPASVVSLLTCIECLRPWLAGAERWRMKVADDESRETVTYCPECAAREFGI